MTSAPLGKIAKVDVGEAVKSDPTGRFTTGAASVFMGRFGGTFFAAVFRAVAIAILPHRPFGRTVKMASV